MSQQILIIGLGHFGMSLARTLSEKGAEVLAVDVNKTLVEEAAAFVTEAVVIDATDEAELARLEPGKEMPRYAPSVTTRRKRPSSAPLYSDRWARPSSSPAPTTRCISAFYIWWVPIKWSIQNRNLVNGLPTGYYTDISSPIPTSEQIYT